MALYSIVRRALSSSSSVLPLVMRSVRSSRTFHSAAASTLLTIEKRSSFCRDLSRGSSIPFLQLFSTNAEWSATDASKRRANENLLRLLETEIQYAEKSCDEKSVLDTPDGFPFEIQDTAGERTILLTREYGDELVKVEVDVPVEDEDSVNEARDKDSGEDAGDEDSDEGEDFNYESSIQMVLSVSKGCGRELEFDITAYPNQIIVDRVSIREPEGSEEHSEYAPDFKNLDDDLQKALLKYLDVRGINPRAICFLIDYMGKKDSKEYLEWLKNLKDFINH